MKSLKILFATAIALCATNAWADLRKSEMGNDVCSPVVHFKLPDGWNSAYLMISGSGVSFPNPKLADDGWTSLDLGSTKTNDDAYFFINGSNKNDCNDGMCVTRNGVNVKPNLARNEGFKCSDIGVNGEIWIMEHPDAKKKGQVYVSNEKPNIKTFYVLLPQNRQWLSSVPLINEDGIDHELNVDEEHCGWYYRRYILDGKIDKKLPYEAIIHMDTDTEHEQAIGMNGNWGENQEFQIPTPISMNALFDIYESDPDYKGDIYFVADENRLRELPEGNQGWFVTYPSVNGYCGLELSATIYDTDASLHPLFSCYAYGAKEGKDGCQERPESQEAIYSCIGVHQGLVESTLDSKTKKPKLTAAGKGCFINDTLFNQLFTYTENVNEKTFFNMPFYRTADGKWEFDSDYYTSPGLDIPVQGGFYPAEGKTDAMVLAADPKQKPVPAARTKRFAEGPVFWGPALRQLDPTEGVAKIDLFCNGPGWNGGNSCDGLFADGEGTEAAITSSLKLSATSSLDNCIFGWSCGYSNYAPAGWPMYDSDSETRNTKEGYGYPRWVSDEGTKGNGGRNQHFCFESHAKFAFKHGLKFSIRGDDDIWVFIDNKLAVDLGGTHLMAPGYVDLDYFMKDAEVGSIYDIDIFFCDRRTTMSNMRISTDIYMYQHEEESVTPNSSSSTKNPSSSASVVSKSSNSTGKDVKSSASKDVKSSASKDSKSSASKDSKSSSSTSKNAKSSSSNKSAKSSSSTGKNAKSSSSKKFYAKPSFHVEMVAPFEFDIIFDKDLPRLARQYAVMDMKGQVLFVGELSSADTRVKVPTSGSYIVSVGYTYKQVNVK